MSAIRFDAEEKALLVGKLQAYFERELAQPLGRFDAEFLLDFVSEQLGAHYYNRGVRDAQVLLAAKFDDLADACYQLERPTELRR